MCYGYVLHIISNSIYARVIEPASMAQSDALPTGDQEIADLIPAWSGKVFLWRMIIKYLMRSFPAFH